MKIRALIPARGGSVRVPGKNLRELNGHPLIAYTIAAAQESGCFCDVYCCSDDAEIREVAGSYGAQTWRREESNAREPDYEWLKSVSLDDVDAYGLLRPTSPFRGVETIQKACRQWEDLAHGYDSLRSVTRCHEHPSKMWVLSKTGSPTTMSPFLGWAIGSITPLHSRPTQALPPVWVQTAGLEIAWAWVPEFSKTISGHRILPFELEGAAAFDLNTEEDWIVAEHKAKTGAWSLPLIA